MSDNLITKCPSSGPTIACLGEIASGLLAEVWTMQNTATSRCCGQWGAGHSDGNSVSTKTRAAARFNVSSIPTLLLLKPGGEVYRIVGLQSEEDRGTKLSGLACRQSADAAVV